MAAEFMAMPSDNQCANYACGNRMGATANGWVVMSVPALAVGSGQLPAVRLSMCSPCATRLSHEIASEREGA